MKNFATNYLLRTLPVFILFCTACKTHILDARIVSMMTDKLPTKVEKGADFEEQWCIDEAPKDEELLIGPGYLDRVVLKAHKKHNSTYFADVAFFQRGTCALMEGKVVK